MIVSDGFLRVILIGVTVFLCGSIASGGMAYSGEIGSGLENAFSDSNTARVLIRLADRGAAAPSSRPSWSAATIARAQALFFDSMRRQGLLNDGVEMKRALNRIPWLSAVVTRQALEKLRSDPCVAMIEPDIVFHAQLAESVPLIGGDTAVLDGFTGKGVSVAVLDTGVTAGHPDLQSDIRWEECFLSDGLCPPDGNERASGPGAAADGGGHGTHVTGIITSDNGAYPGVAPEAGIVAIKVLDDFGGGYLSDIVAGLDWVMDNRSKYNIGVVNMSFGAGAFSGICDNDIQSLTEIAEALHDAGILLFASAGNEGHLGAVSHPACLSSVISVGAVYDADLGEASYDYVCWDPTTAPDQITCYSNVSDTLDLLAPGTLIVSSGLDGGLAAYSGTSMAAPHAAGIAAGLLQKSINATPDMIRDLMINTGHPVYDLRTGKRFPRLDAAAASGTLTDMMSPKVTAIDYPACISEQDTADIQVSASDPSGGAVDFEWTPLNGGSLDSDTASAVFKPAGQGPHPCPYQIEITVTSRFSGLSAKAKIAIGVTTRGDVNQDGRVDVLDKCLVRDAFGKSGARGWIEPDINRDGFVNVLDKAIVRDQFGEVGCACSR